jgi:hypothetical protein
VSVTLVDLICRLINLLIFCVCRFDLDEQSINVEKGVMRLLQVDRGQLIVRAIYACYPRCFSDCCSDVHASCVGFV